MTIFTLRVLEVSYTIQHCTFNILLMDKKLLLLLGAKYYNNHSRLLSARFSWSILYFFSQYPKSILLSVKRFNFWGRFSPSNSVFIYCEFRLLGNSRDLSQWLRASIQLRLCYSGVPEPELSTKIEQIRAKNGTHTYNFGCSKE